MCFQWNVWNKLCGHHTTWASSYCSTFHLCFRRHRVAFTSSDTALDLFFFSVSQQGHTTQVLGNLMVCSNFQVTFSWTWTWSQTSDSLSSMHLIGPDLKIQDGCLINQRLRKFSTVFLLLLLSYLCLIKGVLQEATFFFCFMLFVFLYELSMSFQSTGFVNNS